MSSRGECNSITPWSCLIFDGNRFNAVLGSLIYVVGALVIPDINCTVAVAVETVKE
jgi:hypothetical protein